MGFVQAFPSSDTHDSIMKISGSHRFSADTVSLLTSTHSSGFQLMKGLSHIYRQGSGKQRSNQPLLFFFRLRSSNATHVPTDHILPPPLSSQLSLAKYLTMAFFFTPLAAFKYSLISLRPRNTPIDWLTTTWPCSWVTISAFLRCSGRFVSTLF